MSDGVNSDLFAILYGSNTFKAAIDAVNAFARAKLREDSFYRRVMVRPFHDYFSRFCTEPAADVELAKTVAATIFAALTEQERTYGGGLP